MSSAPRLQRVPTMFRPILLRIDFDFWSRFRTIPPWPCAKIAVLAAVGNYETGSKHIELQVDNDSENDGVLSVRPASGTWPCSGVHLVLHQSRTEKVISDGVRYGTDEQTL